MFFKILASGSRGNCSIIGNENTKVIIDCGPTKKYLQDCFEKISIDYTDCDGLLITHQHSDHIKSIKMFDGVPIYSPFPISGISSGRIISPYKPFRINDLTILPLALSHDTDICVGYVITDGKETIVQVTDTGYLSDANYQLIKGADYYIFESNHDPEMLMRAARPDYVKKRILSDNGHMSNEYSSNILCQCLCDRTKEVVLAHISQEANDYDLAYSTFMTMLQDKGLMSDKLKVKAVQQYEIYEGGKSV